MAKLGRPFTYQSKDEKPVTVSLRIKRDLYEQAQRYVKMHPGMTLTELLTDGLQLRLETPADPRDIILSDDNTVIQDLQEMIRAAVQAEIGKLSDFMGSARDALKLAPAPKALAEPMPELSHDDNTVLQDSARQTEIPPYDTNKYMLGELCKQGHDYYGTGQSLRQRGGKHDCRDCKQASSRAYKQRQREAKP